VPDALEVLGFGSVGLDKRDFMYHNKVCSLESLRCVLTLLHPFQEFHGKRHPKERPKASMERSRFIILAVINSLKIKEPLEGEKTLPI